MNGGTLVAPGGLIVGNSGTGTLTVQQFGTATMGSLFLSDHVGMTGTVNDVGSLSVTNGLTVGFGGNGTLNVSGSLTSSGAVAIANEVVATGSVTVSGTWNHSGGSIYIGGSSNGAGGAGSLKVPTLGTLTVSGAGNGITCYDSTGTLTLAGGTVNTPNLSCSGNPVLTDGALNITGGILDNSGVSFSVETAATHTVSVNLLNGSTCRPDILLMGSAGNNTFTVQSGSQLTTVQGARIGIDGSGMATVTVTGLGSTWTNQSFPIAIGFPFLETTGNGTLNVQNGGLLTTGNCPLLIGPLAAGANGTVNIAGNHAAIDYGTAMISVGDVAGAVGNLNIGGSGKAFGASGVIGRVPGATGAVNLTGTGPTSQALWTLTSLAVGGDLTTAGGTGTLTIGPFSQVTATNLTIWPGGTVNLAGGTLQVQSLTSSGVVSGTGGTLRITGNNTVGGTFNLGAATLEAATGVALTLSGAIVNGGFLRGAGTFAVTGGTLLSGGSTFNSTTVSATGAATFANFSNSGSFTVTSPAATPTALNGFINQGSGTMTIAAAAQINVADFQTYGTLTLTPVPSASSPTLLTNNGSTPLAFDGGSRTFISTVAQTGNLSAGLDLNGNNAIVAGGLFVNNGFVYDSTNGGYRVVADYGSLVKGAGFYQPLPKTINGGTFIAGNSPGRATTGTIVLGGPNDPNRGLSDFTWQINDAGPSSSHASATGVSGPSANAAQQVSGWGTLQAVAGVIPVTTAGNMQWDATPGDKLTIHLATLLAPNDPSGNLSTAGGYGSAGDMTPGLMTDFDPSQSYSWRLFAYQGSYSGPTDTANLDASTILDASDFLNPHAGRFDLVLNQSAREMDLVYTPTSVPEPGTLALLGGVVTGLVFRRRRFAKT
jgi:T5SS/PEP-CTERM-associated repeat protein